jgi:hypothetical protein
MIRMFIRHKINDYGTWRKAYDAFDAERRTLGVTGAAVFQTAGDPSDVTVWHDFATLDKAKSFAASQRLKDVMKNAGVKTAPEIWFASEAR